MNTITRNKIEAAELYLENLGESDEYLYSIRILGDKGNCWSISSIDELSAILDILDGVSATIIKDIA